MRFIDANLYVREIIVIAFILIFILSIITLFVVIRLCKKRSLVVTSAITVVLSFLTVFLTMRGSYLYKVNRQGFEPSLTILKLPIWLYVTMVLILFTLVIALLTLTVLWRKKNLSPLAIKESVDKLPAGFCFYEQSGLVKLINNEMNTLCIATTNKALLDGISFWQGISSGTAENCTFLKTKEEPIVRYPDGKIISFKQYTHIIDQKKVHEIVAFDITDEYLLTEQLAKKLEELKNLNKRLMEYGESITELTQEKELLAAKVRIHDDMGKILLATKRKLSSGLSQTDKKDLLNFWEAEIAGFKKVNQRKKKSNLQVIEDVASLIGVQIEFSGSYPEGGSTREKILITAMHECLTNTVAHANGKTMSVVVENKKNQFTIVITNDGEKPKDEIKERGGLSSLRTLVEQESGKMIVKSQPIFELMIELP